MTRSISRQLIEAIVQKALRDAKDSPDRALRNLVDMAMYFSEGRSQRSFFSVVQELLCNEHSAYYPLGQDVLEHVDQRRLLAFGMNIGYNSCTLGASQIRSVERAESFHIPWSLSLEIDGGAYRDRERLYGSVVEQGMALGIYHYMLFPTSRPQDLLRLAATYPDCAFTLFLRGEELTDDFLDETEAVSNLLLALQYGEEAEAVCGLLRERKLLYSVYIPYGERDVDDIISGDCLACAENLHSPLTVFVPLPACPARARQSVYDYVTAARRAPRYRTIPWEALYDGRLVDSIISDGACSTFFDRDGRLSPLFGEPLAGSCNLFHDDLRAILKTAFPRAEETGGPSWGCHGPALLEQP